MTDLTQGHIEQFLKSKEERNRSKATIKSYRSVLESLLEFSEAQMGMLDDDERMVMKYVSTMSEDWTVTTTNHRISVITTFGSFLGHSWFSDYTKHRPADREPRALEGGMADISKLAAHARRNGNVNLMAVVALCGMTGMRIGEARSVTCEDVDLDEMTVAFVRKGGHEAFLPIPELALPLLEAAVSRCEAPADLLVQRSMAACGRAVKKQAEAVLGVDISTHSLRATKLTHMERNGASLSLVQGCAGHADPRTTMRYTRGTFQELRDAMNL